MPKRKPTPKPPPAWGFYGGCVVCGAPFLVRERDPNPPEVRQSCICSPMAVFAAQVGGHFHLMRD